MRKFCSECKIEYPATTEFFNRRLNRKSGLRSYCKGCDVKRSQRYYQQHKEERANYRRLRYREDPERFKDGAKQYRNTLRGYLQEVYCHAKRRCSNPDCHNYNRYGGRGIQFKFISFNAFFDYVVNNLKIKHIKQVKGLQIDRVNNDGHYECGNIRFVTCKVNNNNRGKHATL